MDLETESSSLNTFLQVPTSDDHEPTVPILTRDGSIRNIITGYFNGYSVEIHSDEERSLLYLMGCFGKSTYSMKGSSIGIMRQRQFLKRCFWHKKFGNLASEDGFLKDVEKLLTQIKADKNNEISKDVIDLVSSDEEIAETNSEEDTLNVSVNSGDDDIVVIVPNSDSEEEDYFKNFAPKCCINKISLKDKLVLSLEEAFFLRFAVGCLQITDLNKKQMSLKQTWELFIDTDKKFLYKYLVYHYFKSKGYIVKPGIKFGGDYLLYKEGPGVNHAAYIVVIRNNLEQHIFNWMHLLRHIRMANTTIKEVLLVEVINNNGVNIKEDLRAVLSSYSICETKFSSKISITTNLDD